ncbi:MAG: hypothetical protein AAF899_02470 [Pseudomonadota bacterium]
MSTWTFLDAWPRKTHKPGAAGDGARFDALEEMGAVPTKQVWIGSGADSVWTEPSDPGPTSYTYDIGDIDF